ncbi:MAG: DNA polymerase Y family protein [Planctomycetota bacterium]|jgi:DNA polymerase-4
MGAVREKLEGARARGVALTTMFVDLDAYFASAEQHFRPALRGRPVGVAPVMAGTSCCIAVSYEARPYGIRTGTLVRDARRMCPGISIVHARPKWYVKLHHDVVEAAQRVLPVARVCSIDEFACRLVGREREADRAWELGVRMRESIRAGTSEALGVSVGIGPNHLLAKVASAMNKPNGLVMIEPDDLPECLFDLELRDFPGIGRRMAGRLEAVGVVDVEGMYALGEHEMERVFGGVLGREWYHQIRGVDIAPVVTTRRSLGHEHVLPPHLRNPDGARGVLVRLVTKAASRLRLEGYWAGRMTIIVRFVEGGGWKCERKLSPTRDTPAFVRALASMWKRVPTGEILKVGVVLTELTNDESTPMPLFGTEMSNLRLSEALDRVNGRYGYDALYPASMHATRKSAPMRIAFSKVPDLEFPDCHEE